MNRFRSTRPFFVLAMETGLRRGDLLRLAWHHVNVESGWIRVKTSKTGAGVEIPISVDAFNALEELRLAHGCGGRLFPGFSEMRVRRAFDLAKKLAGIMRRLRLHDLRHGFGSRLASGGASLLVIARLLGHANTRTSERYARPDRASLVDAIGRLATGFTFQRDISSDTRRTVKVEKRLVPPAGFEPAIFTLKGSGQLGSRADTAGDFEEPDETSGVAAGVGSQRDTVGDTDEALVVDEHDFLYVLVGARSHSDNSQKLPEGFEWAGEPCSRYGSRWASKRVTP